MNFTWEDITMFKKNIPFIILLSLMLLIVSINYLFRLNDKRVFSPSTNYVHANEKNVEQSQYPDYHIEGSTISIETSAFSAQVKTEGYVSGVLQGTFIDKKTGAKELGFGLDIIDFLLQPGWDDENTPADVRYNRDIKSYHGNLPKHYVELPQICTQAKKIPYKVVKGKDFIAVKQWFQWTKATPKYKPGSTWEQYIIFPEGKRYFLSCDIVTSVNTVDGLILRTDLPGHLKHNKGDSFEQIYLSYLGSLPNINFLEDFPPDGKYIYQRGKTPLPERMIRAYQLKLNGKPGPFLAGMTLDPSIVYEGWCHQRGYVCFIQEIGGYPIKAGQKFSAAYIIGYFDSVEEMNKVYDQYKGWKAIEFSPDFENAQTYSGFKD